MYVASDIRERLGSAILVYGTRTDAGANRYAAEELQKHFFRSLESAVPIRKDFEVSDEELRTHDVIFVGRPESNSALAAWQDKIGVAVLRAACSASPAKITPQKRKLLYSPPPIPWTVVTWCWWWRETALFKRFC